MSKKQVGTYAQKLKDPRWQKARLEVLNRDGWSCQCCGDSENTLFVHHGYYLFGVEPWDHPPESLHTLCEDCHAMADSVREDLKVRAGTLWIEIQFALNEMLTAMASRMNGDVLCVIGELARDDFFNDVCEMAHNSIKKRADELKQKQSQTEGVNDGR